MLPKAIAGGGDHEILEPVGGIAFLVQSLGAAGLVSFQSGAVGKWPEIVEESPASKASFATPLMTMQAASRISLAMECVHRAIHRIARSMASRMLVTQYVFVLPPVEFVDHFFDGGLPGRTITGLFQLFHALLEFCRRFSPVDVPDLIVDLLVLAAAVTDLQKPVQKAEDDGNPLKELLKGVLRGRPTVGIDRPRRIFGSDLTDFLLKLSIGFLEMSIIRTGREGQSQNAVPTDGQGHEAFLLAPFEMMFIRRQILGNLLGSRDGRAHQTVSSNALQQPLPKHGRTTAGFDHQIHGNIVRQEL